MGFCSREGLTPASFHAWMHCTELVTRFAAAEAIGALPASVRIAKWAYEQTEQAGGQVWIMKDVLRHLGPEWRMMLGV